MNASDVSNSPTHGLPKSSGHKKATRRSSTSSTQNSSESPPGGESKSSEHKKAARRSSTSSTQNSTDSPPRGESSPTTSPGTPKSPKSPRRVSASKLAREVKVLTETVQALAHKLKRRDKEVHKLQETANQHAEVSLKLENTEERLVEATMDNKSLAIVVQGLKKSLELKQGMEGGNAKKVTVPVPVSPTKKMIDPEEHRKVRMERNSAMTKAGEMAMTLAECRAETDDLRDQLAAVTELLAKQNTPAGSSPPVTGSTPPVTESLGVSMRSLMPARGLSQRNLVGDMAVTEPVAKQNNSASMPPVTRSMPPVTGSIPPESPRGVTRGLSLRNLMPARGLSQRSLWGNSSSHGATVGKV
jgi:hypothetical protein